MQAAILLGCSDIADLIRNNIGVASQVDRDGIPTGAKVAYGVGGKGGSDLVGVRRSDGRALFLEVKSPTGRVRPEQVQFIERMRRSHAIAGIVRSVDAARRLILTGDDSPLGLEASK